MLPNIFNKYNNKNPMATEIIQLITGLLTVILGLVAWVYNREIKKTDKQVIDITLKLADVDKENKSIRNNYITRFENLHEAQHVSEIAILEGLSKLSYDLLTKFDSNNRDLKREITELIEQRIKSEISICRLNESRRSNV